MFSARLALHEPHVSILVRVENHQDRLPKFLKTLGAFVGKSRLRRR
jgi:hypothetical protein